MMKTNKTKKGTKRRGLPKDDRDYNEEDGEVDRDEETSMIVTTTTTTTTSTTPSTKKKKKKTKKKSRRDDNVVGTLAKNNKHPFDIPDVAKLFVSFLSCRDLCNVVLFCHNKTLRSSVTYHHVVRSALMAGGKAKEMMRSIYPLIVRDDSIYVPSVYRLLRLVNATKCEQCNEVKPCYQRPYFGVAFCSDCLRWYTPTMQRTDETLADLFHHPRTAGQRFLHTMSVWRQPYRDPSGEHAGPILTLRDAFIPDKLVQERDVERNVYKQHGGAEMIREAFRDNFAQAEERARNHDTDADHANDARIEKSDAKRRPKTQAVVNQLSTLLGGKEWSHIALAHTFPTKRELHLSRRGKTRVALVKFECPLVDEKMSSLLVNLSKVTPKALRKVAKEITEAFEEESYVPIRKRLFDEKMPLLEFED